jgi:hypothetical protein
MSEVHNAIWASNVESLEIEVTIKINYLCRTSLSDLSSTLRCLLNFSHLLSATGDAGQEGEVLGEWLAVPGSVVPASEDAWDWRRARLHLDIENSEGGRLGLDLMLYLLETRPLSVPWMWIDMLIEAPDEMHVRIKYEIREWDAYQYCMFRQYVTRSRSSYKGGPTVKDDCQCHNITPKIIRKKLSFK